MSLTPLLTASPAIQIHAVGAILALGLGPVILFAKKGNGLHKTLGRIWALSMLATIASSYMIFEVRLWGPFSPIHLLSVYSTYALISGIYYARVGNIKKHKDAMQGLYFGGLIVAGTFTFMPGRVMNLVVFGAPSEAGFYAVLAIVIVGAIVFRLRKNLSRNIVAFKLGKSTSQKV